MIGVICLFIKEILNKFSAEVGGTNISMQCSEIAADIALVDYTSTMVALEIDSGFLCNQV